jgi:hypothetical protein
VKITVIATGFGQSTASRTAPAAPPTPVDMGAYADAVRMRLEPAPTSAPVVPLAADRALGARLSIGRRAPIDLPLAATAGGEKTAQAEGDDAEAGLSPLFDVPAFLRRQEG